MRIKKFDRLPLLSDYSSVNEPSLSSSIATPKEIEEARFRRKSTGTAVPGSR